MPPVILITLYLGAALLPLALAWLSGMEPRSWRDELATGAGMLAFAVILAEFVLSGRFRSVSNRIGMDVTMRFHQLFARTALFLAILHPFLYSAPLGPSPAWDTTSRTSIAFEIGDLATGILAWILLPAFVLISIGRDKSGFKYETWRLMHGLGAILIAALLLHHTLAAGRYSQNSALVIVWGGLFAIAVLTLLFVYFVRPSLQLRRPWAVRSVTPVATRTWELVITPVNHSGLTYKAGQFAWLNVGHSPFSLNENPFSISSAPASGKDIHFLIKGLGDFTSSLSEIEPGTRAYVDAPHGTLVVDGHNAPGIVFIAGGVGIAPMMGLLRQHRLERDPRPTILVYGNRTAEQIAHGEELEAFARENGTEIIHVLSEPPAGWKGPVGMVSPNLIRTLFKTRDLSNWLFVLCGPGEMMEAAEETLIDLGVPAGNILSERFRYD